MVLEELGQFKIGNIPVVISDSNSQVSHIRSTNNHKNPLLNQISDGLRNNFTDKYFQIYHQ